MINISLEMDLPGFLITDAINFNSVVLVLQYLSINSGSPRSIVYLHYAVFVVFRMPENFQHYAWAYIILHTRVIFLKIRKYFDIEAHMYKINTLPKLLPLRLFLI